MRELRYIYHGTIPYHSYYAGDSVTLRIEKSTNMDVVITATDIDLGPVTETKYAKIYHFIMPDRNVRVDFEYRKIDPRCPECGEEYSKGADVCPNCHAPLHKYAGEIMSCHNFICDGVLAWGVDVGRFVFKKYGKVVYVITDMPHVGASDVLFCYQISRADYEHLLSMSERHRIPDPHVTAAVTNKYHYHFLCSESAYAKRNKFTLRDVDLALCDEYTEP